MNRRQFMAMSAVVVTSSTVLANEPTEVAYSREAYEQALADGKPFLLDFYATW